MEELQDIAISAKDLLPKDAEARNILELRANLFAKTVQQSIDAEETDEIRYIRFSIDKAKEYYGIPFKYVKEILSHAQITKIPRTIAQITGTMNYRGALIAVIDFKQYFSNKHVEYNENSSIIVIHVNNITLGILTSRIIGSDQYEIGKLDPGFNFPGISNPELIMGLHEGRTAIINIELLTATLVSQLK